MQQLLALQSAFQGHLLDSQSGVKSGPAAGLAPGLEATIASHHGLPPHRRLQIYHHAYRARLIDALRDSHGHTATYLGQEWFDADARAYVEAHPSTGSNLNGYGAGFAAWMLARHPRDPDIGELAALDWALRRAFDGADSTVLALADLAAIAPPAWACIGFALVPTASLLAVTHNTIALWHSLDQQEAPPRAAPLPEPGTVLVWRRGHRPHFRSLEALEQHLLAGLRRGSSFASMCERLANDHPHLDAAAQAGTLLRRWIDEELLCAVLDPASGAAAEDPPRRPG